MNFYPRSPCGERLLQRNADCSCRSISIHALLAESDRQIKQTCRVEISISIHALLAESDVVRALKLADTMLFLSTLSLRRATSQPCCTDTTSAISIHALLAESDSVTTSFQGGFAISIHALLAESDHPAPVPCSPHAHISIHALLAESDTIFAVRPYDAPIFLSTLSLRRATILPLLAPPTPKNFYPRSPCGERPHHYTYKHFNALFLSTLSLRRATLGCPAQG